MDILTRLKRFHDNLKAMNEIMSPSPELSILEKYKGFGGMGFILNDPEFASEKTTVFEVFGRIARSLYPRFC